MELHQKGSKICLQITNSQIKNQISHTVSGTRIKSQIQFSDLTKNDRLHLYYFMNITFQFDA